MVLAEGLAFELGGLEMRQKGHTSHCSHWAGTHSAAHGRMPWTHAGPGWASLGQSEG